MNSDLILVAAFSQMGRTESAGRIRELGKALDTELPDPLKPVTEDNLIKFLLPSIRPFTSRWMRSSKAFPPSRMYRPSSATRT